MRDEYNQFDVFSELESTIAIVICEKQSDGVEAISSIGVGALACGQ
jgi:hypothetical protein